MNFSPKLRIHYNFHAVSFDEHLTTSSPISSSSVLSSGETRFLSMSSGEEESVSCSKSSRRKRKSMDNESTELMTGECAKETRTNIQGDVFPYGFACSFLGCIEL
ncbi:hypothetical protein Droror1_Dr00027931 [Drosera rotundifolia]